MHAGRVYDLLVADARGLRARLRRDRRRPALRRGRGARGEGQSRRVRDGVVDRELGLLPDTQPLGPGPGAGREQRRPGGGGGGGRVRLLPGLGHGRQHQAARRAVRRGRPQTDVRPREPVRSHRLRKLAGPDRAHHQGREGRGNRAECHSRARPARFHVHRREAARLYERPGRRREGAARGGAQRVFCGGHGAGGRAGRPGRRQGVRGPGGRRRGGVAAPHAVRAGGLLHHRPVRGVGQPRPLRRREVRLLAPGCGQHVGRAGED